MDKKYTSVMDLLKGMDIDEKFSESLNAEIEKKKLSKMLSALRCKANLSQKQMAEKLHCSQSKISKIESSYDKDLTLGEILQYTSVLNLNVEIGLFPHMKIVDKIKYHAALIKGYSDELAHLARADEKMIEGVSKFFVETTFNFIKLITDAAQKMREPKVPQNQLSISTNIELNDKCDCPEDQHKSEKHENTGLCMQS